MSTQGCPQPWLDPAQRCCRRPAPTASVGQREHLHLARDIPASGSAPVAGHVPVPVAGKVPVAGSVLVAGGRQLCGEQRGARVQSKVGKPRQAAGCPCPPPPCPVPAAAAPVSAWVGAATRRRRWGCRGAPARCGGTPPCQGAKEAVVGVRPPKWGAPSRGAALGAPPSVAEAQSPPGLVPGDAQHLPGAVLVRVQGLLQQLHRLRDQQRCLHRRRQSGVGGVVQDLGNGRGGSLSTPRAAPGWGGSCSRGTHEGQGIEDDVQQLGGVRVL